MNQFGTTLILVGLVSVPAIGQSETDPEMRTKLGLPRIPVLTEPIEPAKEDRLEPVEPGLTGGQDWLSGVRVSATEMPMPSRLPEGTILRDRPGTIWKGPGDLLVFLPSPEGRIPGEGAMLIAPSGTRDRMASMLEGLGDGQEMIISGQVLFYHRNNYILISSYRKPSQSMPDQSEPAVPDMEPVTEPQESGQPAEVEDLVRDLVGESRAGSRRSDALHNRLISETNRRALESSAPATFPPTLEDGTYLAQRRARLTRSTDGSWALRFDGDLDGLGDGHLTVLPSSVLMLMEARAGRTPEQVMIVSGRVYTSGGRGYFLPAVFRIERQSEINPIQ